jgi:hypothetical protein
VVDVKKIFHTLLEAWLRKLPKNNDDYAHGVVDGIGITLGHLHPEHKDEITKTGRECHKSFGPMTE